MAETNEAVMEMVRKKIQKNADISTQQLYEEAQKVDSDIGDLTLRQFHARYPLQVKRQMAPKKSGRRRASRRGRRKKAAEVDRGAIKENLLGFAKDLTAAEGKAEMVDVLGNVDDYVDRIAKVLEGGK